MAVLFFLLLFAPLRPARADAPGECKPVDLRPALGHPRMQDGTSWCYANSAADLISQLLGERVSSIDLATTFLLSDGAKLHRLPSERIHRYLELHPDFDQRLRDTRREDDAYTPDRILTPDGMLDTGGRDDQAIVLSNLKGLCLSDRLPPGEENLNKYLRAIHDDYLKEKEDGAEPPDGPIGDVKNQVAKIMAGTFQKWVDQRCGKRVKPPEEMIPHEVAVADDLGDFVRKVDAGKLDPEHASAYLVDELDDVLDSGRAAAIAYDSYDLYPRSAGRPGSTHGDHSSVVAARKKIGDTCYYFVRNHFGETCGYRPEYEPRCEKENGGVWVPADALKHLYSVTSIR